MNVVICEDEQFWIDELKKSIEIWAQEKNVEVTYNSFVSPDDLLKYFEVNTKVDVLFFDISLGHSYFDGIKLANHLRKMGIDTPIIFVTVDSFRATEGYLVDAMGFLLKPIDQKILNFYLNRVTKSQLNQKHIKLIKDGNVVSICLGDIIYIEVVDHTIKIHKTYETITHRGSLRQLLALINDNSFVRIHRSYIISLDKLDYIKTTSPYSVDLIKNTEKLSLPISRNYIENLLDAHSDKLLEMII